MSPRAPGRLEDRVALVTGASRGIGEAIARLFAAEGARVVASARTAGDLERVVSDIGREGGKASGAIADIGSAAGVQGLVAATLAEQGRIDVLVHNAGIFPWSPLEDMADEEWNRVLEVNLTAAYRLLKACIPGMKARGAGRMLFTSSVQGNRAAVPGCAHYAASKAGLNGLIRSAALELAAHGITVNGVEPGLVLTAGVESALSERRRERMAQYVPMKRWAEPSEVAHALLFLASDEAGYVTGQTIVVDGGALLPLNGSSMV